jgi:hypothetical protein
MMGRPGLSSHRKFKRLARDLGGSYVARGVLELIWDTCYEAGDDYLGDMQDIADAAEWSGDPGVLARALWSAGGEGRAGFIEDAPDSPGMFVCHDLWDHAPEYVQRRYEREMARRLKGTTLRDLKIAAGKASGAARRALAEIGEHMGTSAEHVLNTCRTGDEQVFVMCSEIHRGGTLDGELNIRRTDGATPSPSPSPSPTHKDKDQTARPSDLPPGGGGDVSKGRKERHKKRPSWMEPFPDEVVDVIEELMEFWPDPKVDLQPRDASGVRKAVPDIKKPLLAKRLGEILAQGGDLSICVTIAKRFVNEYRENPRAWMKAPQYFFGVAPDAPWKDLYQAYVTNASRILPEEDLEEAEVANG